MKILVTGGAGFVGSHVARHLLEDGHSVTIIDDFNDFYDPAIKRANVAKSGAEVIEGDIRDKSAVARAFSGGIDAVVHLAARAGVRPSIAAPELYISTNIQGTLNLLEEAHRTGVGNFVFASSSSVYGVNEKVPFAESDLIQSTISPYAMTKLAGEQICSNFSHLYGMRTVCLRLFTVYGPGQRPDLAIHKFTKKILLGGALEMYGDGSSERDYTYVNDIVQGVSAALRYQGPMFDIFNLGESETTSPEKPDREDRHRHRQSACHKPPPGPSRGCSQNLCGYFESPRSPRLRPEGENRRGDPEIRGLVPGIQLTRHAILRHSMTPTEEANVTVILPVYNAMPHLRHAVESLRSQTLENFKILVVDDGSTDSSPEYLANIKDGRFEIITQQKRRPRRHPEPYAPLGENGLRRPAGLG